MKVFVKWDPLLEEVICVHEDEESDCEKCIAVNERANLQHRYYVEGEWFEVYVKNT